MTVPVEVERRDAVGIVRMNAPERRNAFDLPMRQAVADAFRDLTADAAIRVIVVSGGDTVFAAGADLRLLQDKSAQGVAALGFAEFWQPVAECPKPVIAAVSGFALGAGCELALMCDMIVADATAQFGQPESRVGIMPGAGGTQRLIRVLGKYVATHLLMGGGTLGAERAYQLGLVSELAAEGTALDCALEVAKRLTHQPPLALAAIKRVLTQGADLPLSAANLMENREFLLLFDTADQAEGMSAFLEKRRPIFSGR